MGTLPHHYREAVSGDEKSYSSDDDSGDSESGDSKLFMAMCHGFKLYPIVQLNYHH